MYPGETEPINREERYEFEGPKRSLADNARLQFVRKVYSLLTIQLTFTMLAILLSCSSQSFARFQQRNSWLAYLNIFSTIGTSLALCTNITIEGFGSLSKKQPINYALLGLFTLSESYLVSMICTIYDEKSVLMCGLLTLAVTAGLTLHALTTKRDYSSFLGTSEYYSAGLTGLVSVLLVVGLANIFFRFQAIQNILAIAFAGIYMVYILVDTQMIMGGRGRKYNLTFDDYIMGAMILYMDIIGLFLKLLELLGEKKRKD